MNNKIICADCSGTGRVWIIAGISSVECECCNGTGRLKEKSDK